MKQIITNTPSINFPAIEATLTKFNGDMIDFATLRGCEDGERKDLITEPLFNVHVVEPITHKGQEVIDEIKRVALPASRIVDAKLIDDAAEKETHIINTEINDRLLKKGALIRQREALDIDPLKKKYGFILMPIALFLGLCDGMLAYTGLKNGYPNLLAMGIALGIAIAISISHLGYCGWIHKSKTPLIRFAKITAILISAFILFAIVGNMRASVVNNPFNIGVPGDTISATNTYHISGWAICAVSFILFSVVMALSLILWKSKKERKDEEVYRQLTEQISKLDNEIKVLTKKKEETRLHADAQKREARAIFDYVTNAIKKCKNICLAAISTYKSVYARYHFNVVPDFFSNPIELSFDDSLHLITTEKK
jgi:hypothetical protein